MIEREIEVWEVMKDGRYALDTVFRSDEEDKAQERAKKLENSEVYEVIRHRI